MRTHNRSHLVAAIALLVLVGLACNRSAPTATPEPASPTQPPPTPSPSPFAPTATKAPPPSPTPTTLPPTDIPVPTPTPTPVIPLACPPPGDPATPGRPDTFGDYPGILAAYLSAGGSAQGLERLLRDWGAVTDEEGEVRSLDMTGDKDPEIVVSLMDPAPEFDLPWPSGDVLIFQCQGGAVVPAYLGRAGTDQTMSDLWFKLHKIEDVNGTGRADVVFVTSSCGAHTCWDSLYVIEWDGTGFVNRTPDMVEYPYAAFTVEDGSILVDVGGIGSAGAGYQRSLQEEWIWNGRGYAIAAQITGPPVALIHYVYDGDDALAQGDYGEAIGHYQAALADTSLPTGLFFEDEDLSAITIRAYARFKLVVAYAASGDRREAQAQFDSLLAEHPDGSHGSVFAWMGQAFWDSFVSNEALGPSCAAAVAVAESATSLTERFYAGYANPEYAAEDFCRLSE